MNRSLNLVTIIALALTFAARGEVLHFTNPAPGQPGHYDWHFAALEGWSSYLDITSPASMQSNEPTGNSVSQIFSIYQDPGCTWCGLSGSNPVYLNVHGGGAEVARGGPDPGTAIPLVLGTPVHEQSFVLSSSLAATYDFVTVYSIFEEEVVSYMGVRTAAGHYGWIAVIRNGMSFSAIEWAYETKLGNPIYAGQVPAPGPLALLAFGAILGPSRKRKPTA